jgi:hypothetical protein
VEPITPTKTPEQDQLPRHRLGGEVLPSQIHARNRTRERCRPEALATTIAPNGRVDLLCVDQLRYLEPGILSHSLNGATAERS